LAIESGRLQINEPVGFYSVPRPAEQHYPVKGFNIKMAQVI